MEEREQEREKERKIETMTRKGKEMYWECRM